MAVNLFVRGPIPVDILNVRLGETHFRTLQRTRYLLLPLRRGVSQTSQVERKAWTRQRPIDPNNQIDECIHSRTAFGCVARHWLVFVLGVDANAFLTTHNAQQARV